MGGRTPRFRAKRRLRSGRNWWRVFGPGTRMQCRGCIQRWPGRAVLPVGGWGAQEIEDKVHDTFLVVLGAIQRGELREPERLMGFVRTVVRRLVATHIDRLVEERRERTDLEDGYAMADERADPEKDAEQRQRVEIMEQVLHTIWRDREILTRFYLYEQSQEQICREMGLNDTQFRLLKSRAKQRFAEIGKRKLEKANTTENNFLRKSAGV